MNSLYFNIYGYKLSIQSEQLDCVCLKTIKEFEYFRCEEFVSPVNCTIHLEKRTIQPSEVKGFNIFKTRMCEVHQIDFKTRLMAYYLNKNLIAIAIDKSERKQRNISISCTDITALAEIVFYVLMSVIGEHLDTVGHMRLHAASFNFNDCRFLVWGQQKSGKSTLTFEMLTKSNALIFSDEVSLVNLSSFFLEPFPISVSLINNSNYSERNFFIQKQKLKIPINRISNEQKLNYFFTLSPSRQNKISFLGNKDKCLLFIKIILGVGLIQMTEYLVRMNNLSILLKIFRNRIRLILYLNKFKVEKLERTQENDFTFVNDTLLQRIFNN